MGPHVLHFMMEHPAYFDWLCEKVNLYSPDNEIYTSLVHLLEEREFYWIIKNDDNRAADGRYLRVLYQNEIGNQFYFVDMDKPCSMFEMLIALSSRLDDILYDSERGPRIDYWFWMLIDNLGLDKATEEEMSCNGRYGSAYVNKIIDTLLERTYTKKGVGGLFPLHGIHHEDQREVEIWYQMHAYVRENFS